MILLERRVPLPPGMPDVLYEVIGELEKYYIVRIADEPYNEDNVNFGVPKDQWRIKESTPPAA